MFQIVNGFFNDISNINILNLIIKKGEWIMKKFIFLSIILSLFAVFSVAQAEVRDRSFSLTPYVGGYFYEGNQDLKDSALFGLRAGYNFTRHFGIEGFASYTQTEIDDSYYSGTSPWQNIYNFGVEAIYHFLPEKRFVPFVAMGLGGVHYEEARNYKSHYGAPDYGKIFEATKLAVDYGAGMKYFVTDNIALRVDVRHILPLNGRWNNPHYIHNELQATFGVNFAFGGGPKVAVQEAAVEEAPVQPVVSAADGDKDGVPDFRDKCPKTPAGRTVDADGCMPDSDGDGILDYEDHCANTPAGVKVDADGCPSDSDFDGVSDYRDKCPGTPHGSPVDEDGCLFKKTSMFLKIEFDSGKSVIKPRYHQEIMRVADFMKKNSKATATIVGHTDNTGGRLANIRLSQNRADSVRQYLISKFGIAAQRIKAMGYGPDRPIAGNKTDAGRKKNRRVVASFE